MRPFHSILTSLLLFILLFINSSSAYAQIEAIPLKQGDYNARVFLQKTIKVERGDSIEIKGAIGPNEKFMGIASLDNEQMRDLSGAFKLTKLSEFDSLYLKGLIISDKYSELEVITRNPLDSNWYRYSYSIKLMDKQPQPRSIAYWKQNDAQTDYLEINKFSSLMDAEDKVIVALKGKNLELLKEISLSKALTFSFNGKVGDTYIYQSNLWEYDSLKKLNPQDIRLTAGEKQFPVKVVTDKNPSIQTNIETVVSDGYSNFVIRLNLKNVLDRVQVTVEDPGTSFINHQTDIHKVVNDLVSIPVEFRSDTKPTNNFNLKLTFDHLIKDASQQSLPSEKMIEVVLEQSSVKIELFDNEHFVPGQNVKFRIVALGDNSFSTTNNIDTLTLHLNGEEYLVKIDVPTSKTIIASFDVPVLSNEEIFLLKGKKFSMSLGDKEYIGDFPDIASFPNWVDVPEAVFRGQSVSLRLRNDVSKRTSELLKLGRSAKNYLITDSSFVGDYRGAVKVKLSTELDSIQIPVLLDKTIIDTIILPIQKRADIKDQFDIFYSRKKTKKGKISSSNSVVRFYNDGSNIEVKPKKNLTLAPYEVTNMFVTLNKVDGSLINERIIFNNNTFNIPVTSLGVNPGDEFRMMIKNGTNTAEYRMKEKAKWWQKIDIRTGISAASYFGDGLELCNSDTSVVSSKWNYLDGIMVGAFYQILRSKNNKNILSAGLTFGVQTAEEFYDQQESSISETTVTSGITTEVVEVRTTTIVQKTVKDTFPRASVSLLLFDNVHFGYAFGGEKGGGWTLGVSTSILDISKFIFGSEE